MQVTSLLSRRPHNHDHDPHDDHHHGHEHDESCGCGDDHSHTSVRLVQLLVGLVFVVNAFIVDWAFHKGTMIASASAMIGSILLGYPIVWTAIKDLKQGILSINELVGIAVL